MSAVLFCPFCREPFEGHAACPEHGLRLVPFTELPAEHHDVPEAQPLPFTELRYGRGWVMLGAALALLAFLLPLARLEGQVTAQSTLLALAQGRAKTLWLVPLAALGQVAVLHRRRSPRGMASAKFAVLWLSLLGPLVVGLTLMGVVSAADVMSERARGPVLVHVGKGAYLSLVSCLASLWGGLRLGRPPRRKAVKVETVH